MEPDNEDAYAQFKTIQLEFEDERSKDNTIVQIDKANNIRFDQFSHNVGVFVAATSESTIEHSEYS